MDADAVEGLAFDTNLLSMPTQRRLMSLWMEVSQGKVLLLPQVVAELRAPNKRDLGAEAQRINAAHRAAWDKAVKIANGPFATVTLTVDRADGSLRNPAPVHLAVLSEAQPGR